jgi:acyl-CoA synthetase (AMP-forming)/AMP-acid ligase II
MFRGLLTETVSSSQSATTAEPNEACWSAQSESFTRIVQPALVWSTRTPNAPAITSGSSVWTYTDLEKAVETAAVFLKSCGVAAGDRVMLIGENGFPLAAFILATGTLDACAVLENARRAPQEVDGILKHCDPRLVVYLISGSPDAGMHGQRHNAVYHELPAMGLVSVSLATSHPMRDPIDGSAQDTAVLIYTTGTTGIPKGVMLSHANLLYLAEMMCRLRQLVPDDRIYGILPITHVMGLAGAFGGTLRAGAHLFLVSRFSPTACHKTLSDERITILQGAPSMFAKLVDHARQDGILPPSCLRFIASGGAPIDQSVKDEAEAFFGLTLHNGYGLTEGSGLCWTRLDRPRTDCSVGLPLPGVELKLLDENKREVPHGEVGELWARGPNIMKGYYRNQSLSETVMQPEGWFNTQDLARIDDDGHLSIVGRTKDLIIASGFNVYPIEVENALNAYEGIVHSAVIGRPNGGNEDIVAFIELAKGKSILPAALRSFLSERLAPYKRPREIYIMDAIPTAPNGKTQKNQLKEIAMNEVGPATQRLL